MPSLYEQVLGSLAGGEVPTPRPPRPSASVVLWRRAARGLQVFWVERSTALPFMGGWHSFPGGAVERTDAGTELRGAPQGLEDPAAVSPQPESLAGETLAPDLVPGLAAAALRELQEETGLELADAARLVFAGRWLTPPLGPLRFDNRFFLLEWPASEPRQPRIQSEEGGRPGELVAGEWLEPRAALERSGSGEVLAAPPVLHVLRVLAEDGPEHGLVRLRDTSEANLGPFRAIEFRPGILLFPLRTPTLPPATHTNCYLVGRGEAVLVDPGSPFPDEIARLRAALEEAASRLGRRAVAIWLTHHHSDHVGGVAALRAALGVPVLAHSATAARLAEQGLEVDGELEDGGARTLAGSSPLVLRVLHTPGHARGHLCFHAPAEGALLCGDLVSGLGTVVIDPPEGDMEEYLASLARARATGARFLLPGHGPAIFAAAARLDAVREHRLEREKRVLAAWQAGLRDPAAMLAQVYEDTPDAARPLAERQIVAHLERLRARGVL